MSWDEWLAVHSPQLLTGIFTLAGGWFGYKLKAWDERQSKRKRLAATWGAISAEVEECRRLAETYLGIGAQKVSAPQWRLPDIMLANSLHALLAEGDPNEQEVDALLKFHVEVESLNRGLDLAQGDGRSLIDRAAINELKAKRLIPGGEYYAPLRMLIDKHVKLVAKSDSVP